MKKPYLIGMLAYGPEYTRQFLNFHLKAVLCPSNLPAVLKAGEFAPEYVLLTDKESIPQMEAHPNFRKLKELVKVDIKVMQWPEGVQKYQLRYTGIISLTNLLVEESLKREAVFTQLATDIIPAAGFFPEILSRLKEGYDSVLGLPWRTAFESMAPFLDQHPGALPREVMGKLAYENMHPLWTHSHWDNPLFSKLPFCLLWNSGSGLLVRTFSVSPLLMTPYPEMLNSGRVLDADIPAMMRKPFWASDWLSAPCIEVGFLFSYYPPFANRPAQTERVSEWAECLSPKVWDFLLDRFFFPSKALASVSPEQSEASARVASAIWADLQNEERGEFLREHLKR